MFRSLYHKYISNKLFGKIIAIYTLILVIALVTLYTAVLGNYSNTIRTRAMNDSESVTQTIRQYFSQKMITAKQLQQLPYYRSSTYGEILSFLASNDSSYTSKYIVQRTLLNDYCQYACDVDPSIIDVHIYSVKNNSIFRYYTNKDIFSRISEVDLKLLSVTAEEKGFAPSVLPICSLYPPDTTFPDSFAIAANLRTMDMSTVIGTVFITLRLSELNDQIAQLQSNFEHQLIIYNKNGDLLYSTFQDESSVKPPPFEELCTLSTEGTSIKGNYIISSIYDEKTGIYAGCCIDNYSISQSISSYRRVILLIMLFCIIFALSAFFFIINIFSERISSICHAMKSVQAGDLSERICIKSSDDEIGLIATSFNQMCDHLQDYIEKVYVAEINQKKAEQYALQSQINPHFLYNTLEAIRMNAVNHQDTETAHMIYLLGTLFRSCINQTTFVSLHEEITYCKNYLSLMQHRYKEQLQYDFSIEQDLYSYGIARHLLQPLIENAIHHGMDPDNPCINISISGTISKDAMCIEIHDSGIGIESDELAKIKEHIHDSLVSSNESIGIANVGQRIRLIYGEQYGLEIESILREGTTVTLTLPLKTLKELNTHVQSNLS